MLEEIRTKSVAWWRPPPAARQEKERQRTVRFESFRAQTFAHVDAVYSDALCLTGSEEAAVSLVIKTYLHAFEGYEEFHCRRVPIALGAQRTLAWLYRNMHNCFCAEILSRSNCVEALAGDRP